SSAPRYAASAMPRKPPNLVWNVDRPVFITAASVRFARTPPSQEPPTQPRRRRRLFSAPSRLGQRPVIQTSRARSLPRSRRRGGRTPQGDAELMAEEQVPGFKPARRLEEVNDEHCERM